MNPRKDTLTTGNICAFCLTQITQWQTAQIKQFRSLTYSVSLIQSKITCKIISVKIHILWYSGQLVLYTQGRKSKLPLTTGKVTKESNVFIFHQRRQMLCFFTIIIVYHFLSLLFIIFICVIITYFTHDYLSSILAISVLDFYAVFIDIYFSSRVLGCPKHAMWMKKISLNGLIKQSFYETHLTFRQILI
jgi:hypothetical protein